MKTVPATVTRRMPQEYDNHSNIQEIPVSQAISCNGSEEVKPSSIETSTKRIIKKGLRYQVSILHLIYRIDVIN
jgi:hypothetical protein